MERDILQLLMQTPDIRYSYKEVGRTIDRKRFRDDARWARPVLERLVNESKIRRDENSLYYFPKPEKDDKRDKRQRKEGQDEASPMQTFDLPDETE